MDRMVRLGIAVFLLYVAIYVMAWIIPCICEWVIWGM